MKQILVKLAIGLSFIALFFLGYETTGLCKLVELKLYDYRFELRGPREPSKDIIIFCMLGYFSEFLDNFYKFALALNHVEGFPFFLL